MDMLQWMLEPGLGETTVALALLPWLAVAMMQVYSLARRDRLDDNFGARAGAALRWAAETPDPITPAKSAVLEYRTRAPARIRVDELEVIEDEAA